MGATLPGAHGGLSAIYTLLRLRIFAVLKDLVEPVEDALMEERAIADLTMLVRSFRAREADKLLGTGQGVIQTPCVGRDLVVLGEA